jgi:predicted RNA binding protein YcfA (HicA-like mRNA interferase family)
MSKWDKLITRICNLSKDLRFDELRKVLESYGYEMNAPRSGSSHYTFRKQGCMPITIPKHDQESICGNGKADCRKRGEE